MHSDGASSDSDVSVSSAESYGASVASAESYGASVGSAESYGASVGSAESYDASVSSVESYGGGFTKRRKSRRGSVDSVCTRPTDEVYMMVLQNRKGLYEDLKCAISVNDMCDVTFLVGEERRPVHGIRAIIATRSRVFYQLILSHEKNRRVLKESQKSKLSKTFSKLSKLTCVRPADEASRGRRSPRLVIPMASFQPETFQRFMNYIHCGTLTVDSNTVIGTMNAAYMFGFPEVQRACWDFAVGCVERHDNLSDIFRSAKLYAEHKMTRLLMRTMRGSAMQRYPDLVSSHNCGEQLHSFAEEEEFMLTS